MKYFFLILAVLSSACISGNVIAVPEARCPLTFENAVVSNVLDGDTLDLDNVERVRLLDINAPEKREHFSEDAKEFLEFNTKGKNVTLGKSCEDKDISKKRFLRYVFTGNDSGINNSINYQLVKNGHATAYFYGYSDYEKEFKEAEGYAKQNKLGIWNTSTFFGCIKVDELDAEKEFVILSNSCGPINLEGWELKDASASHIYKLKNFAFGKELAIFTGIGANTETSYFLNQKITIWNNDGDTLFLRDEEGRLVVTYEYR